MIHKGRGHSGRGSREGGEFLQRDIQKHSKEVKFEFVQIMILGIGCDHNGKIKVLHRNVLRKIVENLSWPETCYFSGSLPSKWELDYLNLDPEGYGEIFSRNIWRKIFLFRMYLFRYFVYESIKVIFVQVSDVAHGALVSFILPHALQPISIYI